MYRIIIYHIIHNGRTTPRERGLEGALGVGLERRDLLDRLLARARRLV